MEAIKERRRSMELIGVDTFPDVNTSRTAEHTTAVNSSSAMNLALQLWGKRSGAGAVQIRKFLPTSVSRQIQKPVRVSTESAIQVATEGSTNRQRPRLLLGRSVGCPCLNVAFPIFQFSARSETTNQDVGSAFMPLLTFLFTPLAHRRGSLFVSDCTGKLLVAVQSNVSLSFFSSHLLLFLLVTEFQGGHVRIDCICGVMVFPSDAAHHMDVSIIPFLCLHLSSFIQFRRDTVDGLLPHDSGASSHDTPLHAAQRRCRRGCHRFGEDPGICHSRTRAAGGARIYAQDQRDRCACYKSNEVTNAIRW